MSLFEFKKRIFWKGPKSGRSTVTYTENMTKGLEQLEEATGETIPDLICMALEALLIDACKKKLIDPPKGEEMAFKELFGDRSS